MIVRARAADERGETLVEMMVTLVLLGIGIAGILSGILLLTKTANLSTRTTASSAAAQAYAEYIQQPYDLGGSSTYVKCATTSSYSAAGAVVPAGYTPTVTRVRYWAGTVGVATAGQLDWSATCPPPTPPGGKPGDQGLQEITLKVTSAAGGYSATTETVVFYKRDATCPTIGPNSGPDLGPC